MLGSSFATLNAYFIEWDPSIYLATAILPEVFTGGYLCTILASYSFIADNSTPETRMLRLSIQSFSHYVGSPVGIPLGESIFYKEKIFILGKKILSQDLHSSVLGATHWYSGSKQF